MHVIKFNQRVGTYNPGEIAGFPEAKAMEYINRKYATLVRIINEGKPRKEEDSDSKEEKAILPRSTKREYVTK